MIDPLGLRSERSIWRRPGCHLRLLDVVGSRPHRSLKRSNLRAFLAAMREGTDGKTGEDDDGMDDTVHDLLDQLLDASVEVSR